MEKISINPTFNNILLKPTEEDNITKAGIIIPDTAKEGHPIKGTVLAIGPGKLKADDTYRKMCVKVGQEVIFKKYGPDEIIVDDTKYLIGCEDDIIAIIK